MSADDDATERKREVARWLAVGEESGAAASGRAVRGCEDIGGLI